MLQLGCGGDEKSGEFSWENSVSTKTSFPKALVEYVIEKLRTMAHLEYLELKRGRGIEGGGRANPDVL